MNKNTIRIKCPNNNIQERKYIIDVLLNQFLGVDYVLDFSDTESGYVLQCSGRILIIEDHFFSNFPRPMEYMARSNIPEKALLWETKTGCFPIIYGRNFFSEENDVIVCGLDIFASSFFLLTRWEEYLLGRTAKGKCKESELFLIKNGLYKRPIVNEYCSLLKYFIGKIGQCSVSPHKFNVMLTHDVDRCYLTSASVLGYNIFQLIRRHNCKKAFLILLRYLNYKTRKINPFDSFDELMDIGDKYHFRISFYFKACLQNEKGYTYDVSEPFVSERIHRILSRGHDVGFHPSENTFCNDEQFFTELQRLKTEVLPYPVSGGRNHGLFYGNGTFRQWDQNCMKYDSGFGFQYFNGFRCGCCYPFKTFDLFSRKELGITEIPFLCMDSVTIRNKFTPDEMFADIKEVIDEVNKHQGTLCLNFHSNMINTLEFMKYKKVYIKIVSYLSKVSNG